MLIFVILIRHINTKLLKSCSKAKSCSRLPSTICLGLLTACPLSPSLSQSPLPYETFFRNISCVRPARNNVAAFWHGWATSQTTMLPPECVLVLPGPDEWKGEQFSIAVARCSNRFDRHTFLGLKTTSRFASETVRRGGRRTGQESRRHRRSELLQHRDRETESWARPHGEAGRREEAGTNCRPTHCTQDSSRSQ